MKFTEVGSSGVIYMTVEDFPARNVFTTRYGGVSTDQFSTLNLGMREGEDMAHLAENYAILAKATGIDTSRMGYTHQVHRTDVKILTSEDALAPGVFPEYKADAVVTAEKGLPLVCFTADCIPVLLCAPGKAVAAVHCGWRSSTADILKNVLDAMETLGARAKDIYAAVGPGICWEHFQVSQDVIDAAESWLGDLTGLVKRDTRGENKYLFDLKNANRCRLEQLGVKPKRIVVTEDCTMCTPDKYWSHRVTHGRRGLQAGIIVL
ncbi:MAG: peptidoglycan editing factor PgeF [Oscillospiraceae bacterium]|nr:peptidoglycan editing factor PgeF [Oscillospiraceae bacterium]